MRAVARAIAPALVAAAVAFAATAAVGHAGIADGGPQWLALAVETSAGIVAAASAFGLIRLGLGHPAMRPGATANDHVPS